MRKSPFHGLFRGTKNNPGLEASIKMTSPLVFLRALNNLVAAKFMSRAARHRYIKAMRHTLGMSYEDYITLCRRSGLRA